MSAKEPLLAGMDELEDDGFRIRERRMSAEDADRIADVESDMDDDELERYKTNFLPLLRRLLILIGVVMVAINVVGVFCWFDDSCDVRVSGAKLLYWALFLDTCIAVWPLSKVVVALIFLVLRRTPGMEFVLGLVAPLRSTAKYIVWGAVMMNVWRVVLVGVDKNSMSGFQAIAMAVAISFCVHAVRVVTVRFLEQRAADKDIVRRSRRLRAYSDAFLSLSGRGHAHTFDSGADGDEIELRVVDGKLYRGDPSKVKTRKRLGGLAPGSLNFVRHMSTIEQMADEEGALPLHLDDQQLRKCALELARAVFAKCDTGDRGFLEVGHLSAWIVRDMAERILTRMNVSGTGQLTREEVCTGLFELLEERRLVHFALEDQRNVFKVVRRLIKSIANIIILLVCLNAIGLDPLTLLLPFATLFLGFAIIFGETVRTLVEALMVIFFGRPFSIGDSVRLGDNELMIRHIGFLATLARKPDGSVAYVPNTILARAEIVNLRRSEDVRLLQRIVVAADTSLDDISALVERVEAYVQERPGLFNESDTQVAFRALSGAGHYALDLHVSLRCTWHEDDVWRPVRHKFVAHVGTTLRDLGIKVLSSE